MVQIYDDGRWVAVDLLGMLRRIEDIEARLGPIHVDEINTGPAIARLRAERDARVSASAPPGNEDGPTVATWATTEEHIAYAKGRLDAADAILDAARAATKSDIEYHEMYAPEAARLARGGYHRVPEDAPPPPPSRWLDTGDTGSAVGW